MPGFDESDFLVRANARVGTIIRGKYKIDSVLGIGGMATVFAVTHQNSQRYALKLLHPELASLESVRKRFVREGYAANNVKHQGVVTVFDNDVDEAGSPFLIMELLEGTSVSALRLPPNGHVPIRETLEIAVQLLDVLSAAHKQGTVHRDIKPSNLFVTESGIVKVLDFGIAQLKESAYEMTQTRTGITLGTPSFMAPEQARAKAGEIDARTDIWAVGATLFTMLSGKFVHEGDNPSNVRVIAATEPARSLTTLAPDVPVQVVSIVDKALAFEKGDRFESAAVMRDAAEGVLRNFYRNVTHQTLASFVKKVDEESRTGETPVPSANPPKPTEPATATNPSKSRDEAVFRESFSPSSDGTINRTPDDRIFARARFRLAVAVAAVVILAGIGALLWRLNRPLPGTLDVMISTDMVVPDDFNWIGWHVKRGDGKVIQSGTTSLSDWKPSPVRLAALSATDVSGLARIDLEARRGGEKGKLILERELQFTMPNQGEKTLTIPLDMLCTEDATPSHCRAGQQCVAGECVDIELSAAAPDTGNTSAGECFDAAQCFASGLQITVPINDPGVGSCVFKMSSVLFDVKQHNIGLVVNTAEIGNYGACGPSGQCIVPLDFGGPDGWEIVEKNGKVLGIRLPEAVCRGIRLKRLFGVAIAPSTPGCPPKSRDVPVCSKADTCVVKEGICPSDFPHDWIGYSCLGAASPQMIRTDLLACFLGAIRANTGGDRRSASQTWCCNAGQPISEDPLVIDTMEGGPQIKRKPKPGQLPGYWWTSSDAPDGEFSPPLTPKLFRYTNISPPVTLAGGRTFDRAACFKSSGFSGWIALMGFAFAYEQGGVITSSIDVSDYTGIRFFAASPIGEQTISVRLADRNTFTEDPRTTCNQNPKAGRCGDDFGIQNLILTPQWKEYEVHFADFTQSPSNWGQARFDALDRTQIYQMNFTVGGRGPDLRTPPFDICISQIYFVR